MEELKLSNVNIDSFRGIRRLQLQDLGNFNLFVGSNNSGKTSILEAISICCRPMDSFQWIKAARGRDVPMGRTPIIESIKWLFPQESGSFDSTEIRLRIAGTFEVRSILAQYTAISALATDVSESAYDIEPDTDLVPERGAFVDVIVNAERDYIQRTIFEEPSELNPTEEIKERFQIIEGRDILQPTRKRYEHLLLPVRTVLPHTHRVDRIHPMPYLDGTNLGHELQRSVIELLRQFDPDIEDISIVPRARIMATYVRHRSLGTVPLQVFGDGLRRIVQIALTIPLCQDGVLLLDEIETSIHSTRLLDSLKWLLSACNQFNVQLFATTHSLEAIDALISSVERQNDFITYKLSTFDGITECTRFDRGELKELRQEFGLEIR